MNIDSTSPKAERQQPFRSQLCSFQTLKRHPESFSHVCRPAGFCCHLYCKAFWAVQRLDPAAQQACPITSSSFLTFLSLLDIYFFSLCFCFSRSQLWKRARAHTDAVLYVSRVFKLFILSSIAFSELCSNMRRVIYYHTDFSLWIVLFSSCTLSCFILDRLSRRPLRTVSLHRSDGGLMHSAGKQRKH